MSRFRCLLLAALCLLAALPVQADPGDDALLKAMYRLQILGDSAGAVPFFERALTLTKKAETRELATYHLADALSRRFSVHGVQRLEALLSGSPKDEHLQECLRRARSFLLGGHADVLIEAKEAVRKLPADTDYVQDKLDHIIVPKISFEEATMETVFKYLKQRSRELDPDGEGVNFLFMVYQRTPLVTLDFDNIPLGEVVGYLARMAGLEMRVERYSVVIGSSQAISPFHTRYYPVHAGSLERFRAHEGDLSGAFQELGLPWREGASIVIDEATSKMIVTHDLWGLKAIEKLLVELDHTPVTIQASFDLIEVLDSDFVADTPFGVVHPAALSQLPASAKRALLRRSLTATSGSEASLLDREAAIEATVKPALGTDGYSIALSFTWQDEVGSLSTTTMIWDGEEQLIQLRRASGHDKARFLQVGAQLTNRAGMPIRTPY